MELVFLGVLVLFMVIALTSGFPVAFALPGSAVLAIGLAALTGERHSNEMPDDFPGLVSKAGAETRVLVTLDQTAVAVARNDPSRWCSAVERFDRDWAAPVLTALRYGKIRGFALWTCDGGSYRLSRSRAWLACFKGGRICRHI